MNGRITQIFLIAAAIIAIAASLCSIWESMHKVNQIKAELARHQKEDDAKFKQLGLQ